jgi:hypothetical protein
MFGCGTQTICKAKSKGIYYFINKFNILRTQQNQILIFVFFISLIFFQKAKAQEVNVFGRIFTDQNVAPSSPAEIINYRTMFQFRANADGTFQLKMDKDDTLLVIADGYTSKKILLRDSGFKSDYYIRVMLRPIQYSLPEVKIFPDIAFDTVKKNISLLNQKPQLTYNFTSPFDAIESPFSYLWEQFSKQEKDKRLVVQLENRDQFNKVMFELLDISNKNGLIHLDKMEYIAFIQYCGFTSDYLQRTSQYAIFNAIKQRFDAYENQK